MKNRFLTLTLQEEEEEKTYNKVFLHRAFPHELLWEYISVIGEDNKEIGLICNIEDFEAETIAILKTEIERKYYSPVITEIKSLKERYGFSYWKVDVEDGRHREDGIVHNAWFLIDIHNPKGGGQAEGYSRPAQPYDIPYGALVPIKTDGLLIAGRPISGLLMPGTDCVVG